MKIIHRFVLHSSRAGAQTSELDDLEIAHEFTPLPAVNDREKPGLIIFEVSEDHPHWTQVQQLAATWSCRGVIRTQFTTKELKRAETLVLGSLWHNGYPMPDHDAGYLKSTYGGTGCVSCGAGHLQTAPFALRSEPNWGRRHFMSLHWITDEIFVEANAYRRVFSKHGIQAREVLHYKSHRPLESVLQLCVPETTVQAELTSYDEVCTVCGKGKYHWPVRGFFPRLDRTEQLPIFKTQTTFGSGGASGRAIIVSQKLYSSIVENRLRGCYFQPVDTNVHAAGN